MAFMILGHGNKQFATFEQPFKGLVKTLTTTIGEFDFDTFYTSFYDETGRDSKKIFGNRIERLANSLHVLWLLSM